MGIKKRVYFNHGVPFIAYHGLLRHLLKLLERVNLYLSTSVISISIEMKKHLLSLQSNKNILILGSGSACGIDLELYSRSRYKDSMYRQNHGIIKNDFVIVFIGRPEKRKGFHFLLNLWKSFSDSKDMKLLLCGPSKEHVLNVIGCIPDNLICVGFTKDIPEILSTSDCLILPSFHEGLSYAVLEAMACECVVIGSDIDGIRNLVSHEKTGYLVPNHNEKLYRELIQRVKNAPDLSSEIKINALVSAQQYSRSTFLPNYIQFLQDYLNEISLNLITDKQSNEFSP
jgi:glycosyltransferase involved in cell wall biosynthesis